MTAEMTVEDFQDEMWDRMGPRKYVAGREAVYDLIAVAVQEWPTEDLVHVKSGSGAEIYQTDRLKQAIRRHMILTHGESKQFSFIWTLIFSAIVNEVVKVILAWWWNSDKNRGLIRKWRQRWSNA